MNSLSAHIDLLIVNYNEVTGVRIVDFDQLKIAPNAIAATATGANPPAGQVLYSGGTNGAARFQLGAGYSFTALPTAGNGHQFTKFIQPIEARELINVAAYAYSAPTYPVWEIDATGETLYPNVPYTIIITFAMQYVGQINQVEVSRMYPYGTTPTINQLMTDLASDLNNNPNFTQNATAVVTGGNLLEITGLLPGLYMTIGFPTGPNYVNGFTPGITTQTQSVVGSATGMGNSTYMQWLVRRWKGMGVNLASQAWQNEIQNLYSLFNSNGCYDIYHFVHGSRRDQITMGDFQTPIKKDTYLAIQRDPEDADNPNANADIMAVKTMMRNYFNEKHGFGLMPDIAYSGQTAVGIWGA